MEQKESKYVMSIIKIPIEIQCNGKTITHDDKMEMSFQEIDKLPENIQKTSSGLFNNLFSNFNKSEVPIKSEPVEPPPILEENKEENTITNAIQQIFKNQIFIKKEDIQRKQKKQNTTFKNKKSKTQRITQKVYPINSNNDQDVDLVQPPTGPELQ